MLNSYLTATQLRSALVKCHTQLGHMLDALERSDPAGQSIGQTNPGAFHDIIVHVLRLLRHPQARDASFRSMITRAYASSARQGELAPSRDAVQSIMAVLATVAATLADEQTRQANRPD